MSIPINTDNSVQPTLTFTTLSTPENLDTWTKNNTSNIYNTSLGNVAIGTTTTNTYKLNINGSLNSTSLYQNEILIDFNSYATNTNLTNNYYYKTTTDNLLNSKQNTLTFSSPLLNTANTISIDLTNYYNKTSTDTLLNTKQTLNTRFKGMFGYKPNFLIDQCDISA